MKTCLHNCFENEIISVFLRLRENKTQLTLERSHKSGQERHELRLYCKGQRKPMVHKLNCVAYLWKDANNEWLEDNWKSWAREGLFLLFRLEGELLLDWGQNMKEIKIIWRFVRHKKGIVFSCWRFMWSRNVGLCLVMKIPGGI